MGRLIDEGELMTVTDILEDGTEVTYVPYSEIEDAPTAYDPDKVVQQLEKRIQTHERCIEYEKKNGTITEEFQQRKAVEVLKEAIEIVKGECATEQSCEWKLEDSESNLYVTGCENRQLIFEGTPEENGYKYCPYCGRKIKRGGVDGN